MEKQLRILIVTLDYSPPVLGGYGVMCAQVCIWLKRRGHEVLVLTRLSQEPVVVSAGPDEDEGAVSVRRILRSYWDRSACLDLPFQEALAVEQHNQAQMQGVLATFRPHVVAFWHMGAMSLGLITTTARLGFPLVFVIGDDWLCYGGWADAWLIPTCVLRDTSKMGEVGHRTEAFRIGFQLIESVTYLVNHLIERGKSEIRQVFFAHFFPYMFHGIQLWTVGRLSNQSHICRDLEIF